MPKAQSKPKVKPVKLTKAGARDVKKKDVPFVPIEGDPADFWDNNPPKQKKTRNLPEPRPTRTLNGGKPKKVLTIKKLSRILRPVKLNRKDDKMANDKQKTNKFKGTTKAMIWALFALHQGFVAWLVITNFDNYVAVAAAITGFGLAVVSVGMVGAILSKSYSK